MKNTLSLRILLVGPPGAGKGTLSQGLAPTLKLPHLSTGDMLREHIAQNTEIGRVAQKLLAKGQYVSDDLALAMIKERLSAADCHRGGLLDGFPRTLPQAVEFNKDKKNRPNVIIDLTLPDELVIKRLCGRWLHKPSGRIYHEEFCPPQTPGIDDVTGEPLIQRPDDNAEIGAERVRVFHKQTAPLREFYSQQAQSNEGIAYITVDGGKSIKEVLAQVQQEIEAYCVKQNSPQRGR